MIKKVSIVRRWRGPVPVKRDGTPIPRILWPKRRPCVWLVRWFAPTPDGTIRRPSRRFKAREEAEAFRTELQAKFQDAPATRRELRRLTLGQFIDEYLTLGIGPAGQKLKPRTVQQARLVLNHFAKTIGRDRPIANISPQHVARYFAGIRAKGGRGAGPATINFRLRMLRSAFGVAIGPMELLRANPFRGFKADRITAGTIRYVTATFLQQRGEFVATLLDGEGKPAISLHDLRRSAATNWSRVANIQTVSRLAGHSDVATTMKFYAAVTDDQIDAIRAANEQAMSAVCGRVPPQ